MSQCTLGLRLARKCISLIKLWIKNSLFVFLSFSLSFQSKAFLQTAASLAPHMYEPHFNLSILSEKVTNSWLVLHLPVSLLPILLLHKLKSGCFAACLRLEIFRAATPRPRSPRTRFRSMLTLSSFWSSCESTFQCCRDPAAASQCSMFYLLKLSFCATDMIPDANHLNSDFKLTPWSD